MNPSHFIECLSAGKGYLGISYSEEYILFDLETKKIQKRGKGQRANNKVEKLRWIKIIDRHQFFLAHLLIKGYNHHNPQQSKMGKPNLHFKTQDLKKN